MASCRTMFAVLLSSCLLLVAAFAQDSQEISDDQYEYDEQSAMAVEDADKLANGRAVAEAVFAASEGETDEGDAVEAALNHCPVMCSPQTNSDHPLRPMLPKYPSYGVCMDDCVCAAYCYILDSLGEWLYADCFKQCGTTQPFSGADPNAFMKLIYSKGSQK